MHANPRSGISLADGLTYLRDLQWRYDCEVYVSLKWHRTASKGLAVWELRAAFPDRGVLPAWHLEVREPAPATKRTSEMGTLFQAVIRLCTEVEEHSQSKYWKRGDRE